jgi:hypothetical protein
MIYVESRWTREHPENTDSCNLGVFSNALIARWQAQGDVSELSSDLRRPPAHAVGQVFDVEWLFDPRSRLERRGLPIICIVAGDHEKRQLTLEKLIRGGRRTPAAQVQ